MGDIGTILIVGGIGLYAWYYFNQQQAGATPTSTPTPTDTEIPTDPGITTDTEPVPEDPGITSETTPGEPTSTPEYIEPDPGPGIGGLTRRFTTPRPVSRGQKSIPPGSLASKTSTPERDTCIQEGGVWKKLANCCQCPNQICEHKCPGAGTTTTTTNTPGRVPVIPASIPPKSTSTPSPGLTRRFTTPRPVSTGRKPITQELYTPPTTKFSPSQLKSRFPTSKPVSTGQKKPIITSKPVDPTRRFTSVRPVSTGQKKNTVQPSARTIRCAKFTGATKKACLCQGLTGAFLTACRKQFDANAYLGRTIRFSNY